MAKRNSVIENPNFQSVISEAKVMNQRDLHTVALIHGGAVCPVPGIRLIHLVAFRIVEHNSGAQIIASELHDDGRGLNHRCVSKYHGKGQPFRVRQHSELELAVRARNLDLLQVHTLRPAALGRLRLCLGSRRRKTWLRQATECSEDHEHVGQKEMSFSHSFSSGLYCLPLIAPRPLHTPSRGFSLRTKMLSCVGSASHSSAMVVTG